jgi:hypothetical protein
MVMTLMTLTSCSRQKTGTGTAKATDSDPTSKSGLFVDKEHGIRMTCPVGWAIMSPAEVTDKTPGQMKIAAGTTIFCVNRGDFDQNVNVIAVGDTSSDAPTNEAARVFLNNFRERTEVGMTGNGVHIVSADVHDFAGGVALEIVSEGDRQGTAMKSRQMMIISHRKGFTITCTATRAEFDNADGTGFSPLLSSIEIE